MPPAPASRVLIMNEAPVRAEGRYVLYWLTWARRSRHSFGLEHAAHWARELGQGLMVLEPLRAGYPWASPRLHAFILPGMAQTHRALSAAGARVHTYVEPALGHGSGLLAALAQDASLVVTDYYPTFFYPHMLAAAAKKLDVALEAVDSCGIVPLTAPERWFPTAYSFRRWLQKNVLDHLAQAPPEDPLAGGLPPPPSLSREITQRWPAARLADLEAASLSGIELPAGPAPVDTPGGEQAAREALAAFLDDGLDRYADGRNQPGGSSGLSPYLHFGQLSPHEVFAGLAAREAWAPHAVSSTSRGQREGWWGMSPGAEAFLDQMLTWRELGHLFCHHHPALGEARPWRGRKSATDYAAGLMELLPDWAQKTLAAHAHDPREYVYSLEHFDQARTHDELWNACQRQLREEGVIESYLRMLWGKKILEWSPSPVAALAVMIELNNRYATDGRDPNSYSGIMWCLGLFDRAFGPRREVFGTVRFMSSDSTRRKIKLKDYLERFGG